MQHKEYWPVKEREGGGEKGRRDGWEEKRRCEVPAVFSPLAAALYHRSVEPTGRPSRLCPAPPLKQPPPGEEHGYPRGAAEVLVTQTKGSHERDGGRPDAAPLASGAPGGGEPAKTRPCG